jgi:hypothetical protein
MFQKNLILKMFAVFDQDDVAALFIEAVLFSFLFFICVSNIHT